MIVGLQTRIRANRARSVYLLLTFPVVLLVVIFLALFFTLYSQSGDMMTTQDLAQQAFSVTLGSLGIV